MTAASFPRQKILYYCQAPGLVTPTNHDQYCDAQYYYTNEHAYTLEPAETVIIIIRNCGNHWLRHGLSYLVKKDENNQFSIAADEPLYQQGLWVSNTCDKSALEVGPQTPLSHLLSEQKINFSLCHIAWPDLYEC